MVCEKLMNFGDTRVETPLLPQLEDETPCPTGPRGRETFPSTLSFGGAGEDRRHTGV